MTNQDLTSLALLVLALAAALATTGLLRPQLAPAHPSIRLMPATGAGMSNTHTIHRKGNPNP